MRARLPPLTLRPKPSRWLPRYLWGLQGLALGVLIAVPTPLGANFGLLVLWAGLGLHVFRQQIRNTSRRIVEIRIEATYACRLVFADGCELDASLRGDSLVTTALIVLRFDGGSVLNRPSLVLDRDSLSGDDMRRLRILLNARRQRVSKANSCPE